jgi:hypothetical protein
MNAEVAVIKPPLPTVAERALLVFKDAKSAEDLKALAAQSADITTITNADGYEQVKRFRINLKNERLDLERIGEDGRADAVAVSKGIIARQKALTTLVQPEEQRLQGLQDAWDAKIAAEKEARVQAELERQKKHREAISKLARFGEILTPSSGSARLDEAMAQLEAMIVDESFEEFQEQAVSAKAASLKRLGEFYDAARTHEDEQRKLAEERAEFARLKAEEAERQRIAAENQAKLDAEAKAEREKESRLAQAQRDAEAEVARGEHSRLIEEARVHAKELATKQAAQDKAAAEREAALNAEAARIAAERAQIEADRLKVEADRDALLAAQKPALTTGNLAYLTPEEAIADDLPPVYRLEEDGDFWTISYLDSEGDTVFVGTSWEHEDEAEEVVRLMHLAYEAGRSSMIPKVA